MKIFSFYCCRYEIFYFDCRTDIYKTRIIQLKHGPDENEKKKIEKLVIAKLEKGARIINIKEIEKGGGLLEKTLRSFKILPQELSSSFIKILS